MNKILWVGILLVAICSSCSTVGMLRYDRLQAADVNFPNQIRTVGVVNCLPPSSLETKDTDGVLQGDGKIMAETFAQAVAGTDYFEQVILCDSALYGQAHVSAQTGGNMSQAMADSLIQALGVDLLFSLENIYIQLKEGVYLIPGTLQTVPVIDGVITPVVKAYTAGRTAPLFMVSKSDSIFWEVNPSMNLKQVIEEASEFAATVPMKHILPHWEHVERGYFNGGNVDMRDAGVYVQEDNWEEAKELWLKIFGQKKGAAQMRAAYNLALYYEWLGDFPTAKEYLEKAIRLAKEGSSEWGKMTQYRIQLEKQAVKNQQLQMQMQRFQDNF